MHRYSIKRRIFCMFASVTHTLEKKHNFCVEAIRNLNISKVVSKRKMEKGC